MRSEIPRYRCALEKGFLPEGSAIAFAKLDYREGVGSRVEQDDEFDFEGDPGAWMDPINDAARERVQKLVDAKQRKTLGAETSAPNTPLKVPKSGMGKAVVSRDAFDELQDARPVDGTNTTTRAAPRRRAAAAS